jgi:hypothetical protein
MRESAMRPGSAQRKHGAIQGLGLAYKKLVQEINS